MIQAIQEISEVTRSNIVNLFPEYSSTFEYSVEPIEEATLKSTVRIENYLYHSTANDNIGNHPLETLGKFWVKGDVSNIYAMLDFEGITKTVWDSDGVVEFDRGNKTILALSGVTAGCVAVDMLEPKNGVLNGLSLSNILAKYTLTSGSWYADNKYDKQTTDWNFKNTDMYFNSDNYLYAQKANPAQNIDAPYGIITNNGVAYMTNFQTSSISALDLSNPSFITEISNLVSTNLLNPMSLAIQNDIIYVVTISGDITAIDISNPALMLELGSFSSLSLRTPRAIKISGSVAYITGEQESKIVAIDITNPASMTEISSFTSASFSTPYGLEIDGTVAYVTDYTTDNIIAVNITNPASMSETSSFTNANLTGAFNLAISGSVAYVTSNFGGKLVAVDITSPASMSEISVLSYTNLFKGKDIDINGTVAYVISEYSEELIAVDIANPATMSVISSIAPDGLDGAIHLAVDGSNAYITGQVSNKLYSMDISNPEIMTTRYTFPENAPSVIAVSIGGTQPATPEGELLIWKVSVDAGGNFISSIDLRASINDNPIDGLTQIETFYNEGKGAVYFELPELGDIVRVTFLEANSAGTACGTMIAGKGIDMGKTLADVNFSQTPRGREYVDTANIVTSVDRKDLTLLAHKAKQAINEYSLLVIDPSAYSDYQNMMILGKIIDVPYSVRAMNNQHLGIKMEGEEMVNEIPLYVYDVAYFIAGVTEVLEVYKGCGNMNFTRPSTAPYEDKYGNTKTAAIDEPRFQDGMLMSGAGEVCWYDALESIPTFENGFTFEWEGITDILAFSNQEKTYIMSNTDVQMYFQGEILYFILNGDSLAYALPILNTRIKVEIRAESNGEVTMVIDDIEVASEAMDISNVSSSLTYIGSNAGLANTSGVLLQTASHKWYNTALDNTTATIPVEVWLDALGGNIWTDGSTNQWTTG